MANIRDYYTEGGRHYVLVTPGEEGWIPYQARMICVNQLSWLAPCCETDDQEGIVYDISDCVSILAYPVLQEGELDKVMEAFWEMPEKGEEYLLEAGGCSSELKYIFWDARESMLRGIYIPESSKYDEQQWLQKTSRQLLGNAITKRWGEKEVVRCYRLYQESYEGKREAVGEPEISPEGGLAESQAKTAKMARYALWDELSEDEPEEENAVQEAMEKVKGKMKRFLRKKEK